MGAGIRNATFRQLQMFVAVARRLSFARVAEDMDLTPAAVSFQIRQLEDIAGFSLFDRVGKRIQLTGAGRLTLGYAETALQAMADADRTLTALKDPTAGEINLGFAGAAHAIAPHIAARFCARQPGSKIRLADGEREDILARLERGEVDFAMLAQASSCAELAAHPFAPHPHVLVVTPSHPLAKRRRLTLRDLANERFIVREEGAECRLLLEMLCRQARFVPEIAAVAQSGEALKQMAIAGVGVALTSRPAASLELGLRLLAPLRVNGAPWMRNWFLVHRRSTPDMPLLEQFKTFVLSDGAKMLAGVESSYARLRGAYAER